MLHPSVSFLSVYPALFLIQECWPHMQVRLVQIPVILSTGCVVSVVTLNPREPQPLHLGSRKSKLTLGLVSWPGHSLTALFMESSK